MKSKAVPSKYDFDFNYPRLPFQFLEPEGGKRVQDAWIELNHDKYSPRAWITACVAAHAALPKLAALANAPDEAKQALAAIGEALLRTAMVVKTVPKKKKLGPRSATAKDLEFQGRAVIAVKWLQHLKIGAMSPEEALREVAPHIPTSMVRPRRAGSAERNAEEVLADWIDTWRPRRPRNSKHKRVLSNLRYEIWEAWYRRWKEPVIAADGNPVRAPDGTIEDKELERDETDASPADVINWLKSGSDKN